MAALFGYAEKRGYIDKNPVSVIDKIKLVDAPPEILTPDQLQKALDACPADLLPCIALGAFAGLRTAELLRLEWHDIDLKRGFINVAASKSKTAKRRLIKIAPNLADWLRPYSQKKGKLYPYSHRWYHLNVDLLKSPQSFQNGQITGFDTRLLPITLPSIRTRHNWRWIWGTPRPA